MALNNNVVDALCLLSEQFILQKHFPQAIKCLMALTSQELLPATEALARLKLGRLLLDHTDNYKEAKKELQKAQIVAAKLHGSLCIKCEIFGQLARCHSLVGDPKSKKQAYLLGLSLCEQGRTSSEGADLLQWAFHFYLHLAEAAITQEDSAAALEMLHKGQLLAAEHKCLDLELLFNLSELQLHLMFWDRAAVERCTAEIDELLCLLDSSHVAADFVNQAKLHFNILQVVTSLHMGHLNQLVASTGAEGQSSGIITKLEQLLESTAGQPRAYEWLQEEAVAALVMLLCANVLRPENKLRSAHAYLSRGEALVQQQLAQMGISPGVNEVAAGAAKVKECGIFLVLKLLLLETAAHLALVQCLLCDARRAFSQAAALVDTFPIQLRNLEAPLHLMLGLFAHSCDEWDAAQRHFAAARNLTKEPQLQMLTKALEVLVVVASGDPHAVSKGIDLLGPLYRDPQPSGSSSESEVGCLERACCQLAAGVLHMKQGQQQEASHVLSRALRLAHGRLCNHQLVSSLLVTMAPLQLQVNDVNGAQQMFTSAFTMAKNGGDLHLQAAALPVLGAIYSRQGETDKVASNAAYLERKTAELRHRQQKAKAEDPAEYERLLGWRLQ